LNRLSLGAVKIPTLRWLLGGWLLLVCGLALAVGVARPDRPGQQWVRVYGGPTDGACPLVWRLQLRQLSGTSEIALANTPVNITVSLANGQRWVKTTKSDGEGQARVSFERPPAEVASVTVRGDSTDLATGRVRLSRAEWWSRARKFGGWAHGQNQGRCRVEVGVTSGVLLVGLPGVLVISVRDPESPRGKRTLRLLGDGIAFLPAGRGRTVETDHHGIAAVPAVVSDIGSELEIRVEDPSGNPTLWRGPIPARLGGIWATVKDGQARFVTTVPREQASFALVSERGIFEADTIALHRSSDGLWRGTAAIQSVCGPDAWIMTGPEVELAGTLSIGWPVVDSTLPPRVHEALVVPERLLLDGRPQARARALRSERRFVWVVASCSVAAAALLLASLWLRVSRASRRLKRHMRALLPADADALSARQRGRLWVASILLAAGVLALGLWWLSVALRTP